MTKFGSLEIPVFPGLQVVEADGHPMTIQNNGTNTVYLSDRVANPRDTTQVTPFAVNQTAAFDGSVDVYATALPGALSSIIRFPGSTNFFQPASQVGKATISATQPVNPSVGDIWFDTAAGNAMFTWNGSAWVAVQFGTQAIAASSVTAALIAAGTVVAGIVNGTTLTGATVIADGSSGGLFVYSGVPALGNLILASAGIGGSDSFGNQYFAGTTAIDSLGSYCNIFAAALNFGNPTPSINSTGQIVQHGNNRLVFTAPTNVSALKTANLCILSDAVLPSLVSDPIFLVEPGQSSISTPEVWHTLGTITATGYTKLVGNYRMSVDAGDFVQFDIQLTANAGGGTAGTYAFGTTLAVAYRPARIQSVELIQSATVIAGAVFPCVTVATNGTVSIKVGAYAAGTVLTCSGRMSLA
jgi:hypothetical protein